MKSRALKAGMHYTGQHGPVCGTGLENSLKTLFCCCCLITSKTLKDLILIFFSDRISLCSPRNPSASAFQVLGLQHDLPCLALGFY